jgi:hypothetical protein
MDDFHLNLSIESAEQAKRSNGAVWFLLAQATDVSVW